ncbi:GNAT family N-acetyltransferase [Streptomyces hoynatensis]|uniref:N-acetyltransferase n=1 Tax=Streptomyces hoynatensis TaxID=1141874 RepID=A0A3A9Z6Y6_9ACTN|nr:GNAT family N-acetyltransferase [Streptomyces hoynatensis]RKN44075.1 N-acetyltransferase [Streptomyces hoynatensis]
MNAGEGAPTVRDNTEARRFEALADGEPAGFAEYQRSPGLVVYPHTEVRPEFEGRGVGGSLARAALEDARSRGLRALVLCPFMAGWLRRHPEYRDVAMDSRPRPRG